MKTIGTRLGKAVILCLAALAVFAGRVQASTTTYAFSGGSAWLTAGNWTPNTPGSTGPGIDDVAQFTGYDGTGGLGAGVNFGNAVNNSTFAGSQGSLPDEAVGMISVTSGNTATLTIGATKNGAANSGYMTFNGVTFSGQANTILANFGTGTLVLANESQGATGSTSGVVLGGTANFVQIGAGDNITITATINQVSAGSSITLLGNGNSTTSGGILELGGTASTFTGGITVGDSAGASAGILQLDTTGALPTSGTIAVNNNSQLLLNVTNGTFGGSSQTLSLTGTGGASAAGSGALRTKSGATLTWAGNITLNAGTDQITATGGSGTLTIAGAINGAGLLQKQGAGTLILGGTNTYGGGASINTGTLQISLLAANGSAQNLGEGSTLTLGSAGSNGTLQYTGTANTLAQNITVTTSGTGAISNTGGGLLIVSGTLTKNGSTLVLTSGSFKVTGQITGANGSTFNSDLDITGSANVILSATNNNYFGPTVVSGSSTLKNGVANALPTNTILTLGATSDASTYINTYDLSGGNQSIAGLASAGSGSEIVTTSAVSSATNTLTLTGTNVTETYGGVIKNGNGALALTVNGGDEVLSGGNTYTGATTINGGVLSITGSLGATAVTVNSGGALSGTGNGSTTGVISGAVTVNGGGGIDFSKDGLILNTTTGTTTLTLAGGLTLTSGSNAATSSFLTFNGNSTGTDSIKDTSLILTGSGSVIVNINGNALSSGTYNLITYTSESVAAGSDNYTIGARPAGLVTLTVRDNTGADAVQLTVAVTAYPNLAYWYGAYAQASGTNTWGGFNATGPVTNWAANSAGTVDAGQVPGAVTDVVFTAAQAGSSGPSLSGSAINSVLEMAYTINSLTFDSTPASVNISGSALTIMALASGSGSLGYAAGTGIVDNSGSSPLTIANSTLTPANSQSWANNSSALLSISANVTGAAVSGSTTTLTLSGTGSGNTDISGAIGDGSIGGTLTLAISDSGVGIAILSASNSYSGGTTLTSGTLQLGNAFALGSTAGSLAVNAGTVDLNGLSPTVGALSGSSGGLITLLTSTGTSTLTTSSATSGTYAGVLSDGTGTLALIKAGSGTLVLAGSNSYSGGTSISGGGELDVTSDSNLGASTGSITISGGSTLATLSGSTAIFTTTRSIFLSGNSANTIDIRGSSIVTDNGVIQDLTSGGTFTKSGGGTLILGGTNTYTGNTTISNGTLTIGGAGQLGSGSYAGNIAITGTFIYDSSASQTLSGVISGAGAFTVQSGSLALTALNTYTGNTTISSGGILSTGATGTLPASGSVPSAIGDTGNSATHLILDGGTLQYANTGAAETTNHLFTLTANGGTLDASGANAINFSGNGNELITISGTGTRTLTLTGTNTGLNILAPILADSTNGASSLAKTGSGTWELTGANTYSGGTTISGGGELDVTSDSNLGASTGSITISGGSTLATPSGDTVTFTLSATRNIFLTGNSGNTIDIRGSSVVTYNGSIQNNGSSNGTFTKSGGGELILGGSNSNTGATTVSNGTLLLNGTLNGSSVANSATFTESSSGAITGAATFTNSAGGFATLGGSNTYTGATTVTGGTLQLAAANTLPAGTVVNMGSASHGGGTLDLYGNNQQIAGLTSGVNGAATYINTVTTSTGSATLTINLTGGSSYTYGNGTTQSRGVLSGALSLVITGSGTQTLGDWGNTYTGTTTITGATLVAGPPITFIGGAALGNTSNITINTGGTLLYAASSGAQAPTNAAMTLNGGTFNVNGNSQGSVSGGTPTPTAGLGALTLTANSTIDFGSTGGSDIGNTNIIAFADSSSLASSWSGELTILDWNGTPGTPAGAAAGSTADAIYFGNGSGQGLTSTQLAEIQFLINGTDYAAAIDAANGEVYAAAVPEPTTILAGLFLIGLAGYRERKRLLGLLRRAASYIRIRDKTLIKNGTKCV